MNEKSILCFSAKIVVHLQEPIPGQPSGPISYSKYNYIRLSFRDSGESEVSFVMLVK